MTHAVCSDINIKRLAAWAGILIDEHSTPAILIGFGHDHHSGQIHVVCVEDLKDEELIGMLYYAIRQIKKGDVHR